MNVILTTLVLAITVQAPTNGANSTAQQEAPANPNKLIERAFQHYYGAKTLQGTIRMTQSAAGRTVVTDTTIALARPDRIRITQTRNGEEPFLLVSDGQQVSVMPPQGDPLGPKRYLLPVKVEGRPALTIPNMYGLGTPRLLDQSPILDAMIANPPDMKRFADQLAQYKLRGRAKINGQDVSVITGAWRTAPDQPAGATFELYLSDAGDILRYVLRQKVAVNLPSDAKIANPLGNQPIEVLTIWDASSRIDEKIDPSTFLIR